MEGFKDVKYVREDFFFVIHDHIKTKKDTHKYYSWHIGQMMYTSDQAIKKYLADYLINSDISDNSNLLDPILESYFG